MPFDWQSRALAMPLLNRAGTDLAKPEGRPPIDDGEPSTPAGWKRRERRRSKAARLSHVMVMDFETDPFDNERQERIQPFLCCMYSDLPGFEPIIIWEENFDAFVDALLSALEALPEPFTIYAHNGGKFDYMFIIHKLRGSVMFKGRSLMRAALGRHELRDSLHIIPERLASWRKDEFDYLKLGHNSRATYRDEIIRYCLSDCKYAMQVIRKFVADNGLRLTIGQASIARLRQSYTVARIGEHCDGAIRGICTDYTNRESYGRPNGRGFYHGGRVECIAGRGYFRGDYRLYDVNSMYPYVMAQFQHPIGAEYSFRRGRSISDATCFVHLRCTNRGGLVAKDENGMVTGNKESGEFYTTIHEYRACLDLKLISDVEIIGTVECNAYSDFSDFVVPLYARRQEMKRALADLAAREIFSGDEYDRVKLDDICMKYYLNNAYGKFGQNPRNFGVHYITGDSCERPPGDGWLNEFSTGRFDGKSDPFTYTIWRKQVEAWNERTGRYERDARHKLRFYNIGTGSSITGAARSVLLRALCHANGPIYCDTDSIICRSLDVAGTDGSALGAWKLEATFNEVIIAGKKLYAVRTDGGKAKVKSKGVDDVKWDEMERLLADEIITKVARAPTLDRMGGQTYGERKIRATAPIEPSLFWRCRAA